MSIYIGPLVLQNVYNAVATSATSATAPVSTDALLTGMTLTPIAGTYFISSSFDVNSAVAGAVISVSVYIGGVQVADSLRKIEPFSGGTLTTGSARAAVHTQALTAVNGAQAIEIRWSTSTNGPTAATRNLIILKVA